MQPKALAAYVDARRAIFDVKTDSTLPSAPVIDPLDLLKVMGVMGRIPRAHPTQLPKQGSLHQVFPFETEGGQYALRILNDPKQAFSLHVEDWAANAAIEARFPTVAPVLTDTSRYLVPFDFQILPWVEGVPLEVKGETDDTLINRALATLAHALTRLHQVHLTNYGPLDPRGLFMQPKMRPRGLFDEWHDFVTRRLESHLDQCLAINALTPPEAEIAEDIIDTVSAQADFDSVLLHGDLANVNILVVNGGVTVIDWEDCLAGDPIWDLADWCAFHMPERWGYILDNYYLSHAKPADFELRFWAYYLRIVLARTVQRHKRGKPDNPKYPLASRRIQLALGELAKL